MRFPEDHWSRSCHGGYRGGTEVKNLHRQASLFTNDNSGKFFKVNYFGELGLKKGRISLLLQSSLESPQSFPMPDISLRGLLQSSKLSQGRRKPMVECIRVATGWGRLLFLCMIILKASRPES